MVKTFTRLLLISASMVWVAAAVSGERQNAVLEGSEAAKLNACVEPTSFMRRQHFELIKHQRDITVRQGIRDTDDSLAGCVECHVARDSQGGYIPIDGVNPENGEKQFCAACHEYTGVQMDCFSCHAAKPTKTGN